MGKFEDWLREAEETAQRESESNGGRVDGGRLASARSAVASSPQRPRSLGGWALGLFSAGLIFGAILVAVLAVLLAATSLLKWLDGPAWVDGRAVLTGVFPVLHRGTPWGFTLDDLGQLNGQEFLVTGGNVGLGYWTARHLAQSGANVVIACRSMERCEAAAASIREDVFSGKGERKGLSALFAGRGGEVRAMELGLAAFESIRSFAAAYAARKTRLDGLILNAGVMLPPFQRTAEGLESQIGINHFGHFLLTTLLLPLLEKTASRHQVATVTVVASNVHYYPYREGILPSLEAINDPARYDRAKAYGQSKLANVLFAQELAARVEQKNVLVNALNPGAVNTELFRHVTAYMPRRLVDALVRPIFKRILWEPEVAALTILYAAASPELRAGKKTGGYYHPIARPVIPGKHTFNATLQAHLWNLSEAVVAAFP